MVLENVEQLVFEGVTAAGQPVALLASLRAEGGEAMSLRYCPDPLRAEAMSTEELRGSFLVDSLFAADRISLVFSDLDRAIVGPAVPATRALALEATPELRAGYFCERRELGVLNIGGPGKVTVDGTDYSWPNATVSTSAAAARRSRSQATRPRTRPSSTC